MKCWGKFQKFNTTKVQMTKMPPRKNDQNI